MPKALSILFSLLIATSVTVGQTVSTDPIGAVNITFKGNSDTIVAVPLCTTPEFTGKVSATATGGTSLWNLSVTGTTGWTTNQFAGVYYVRLTSGVKNGMYYTVTANTGSQLTVDTAGDNLAGIAVGDSFKIYKHWTLGTLFPVASAGTSANPLTASLNTAAFNRRSQILLPDNVSPGINLSAAGTYFFTTQGWVSTATGYPDATNTILAPDSYFIVRQPLAVPTDVVWTSVGSVAKGNLVLPLATQATTKQDNFVALCRPLSVSLANSGLETGFMDSLGLEAFNRRDVLLVFDNTTASFNKSAAKTFFRYNGNWYQATTGSPIANDELLTAGMGFIIRKYQVANAPTALWSNSANY